MLTLPDMLGLCNVMNTAGYPDIPGLTLAKIKLFANETICGARPKLFFVYIQAYNSNLRYSWLIYYIK